MSLVERVAAIEHDQWMHWSKDVAETWPTPAHWPALWLPYADLPEEAKEKDREWARIVLEALGLVTCQTCGGKGRIYTEPNDPGYTCPDCLGLGVVPSDETIERAAKGSYESYAAESGYEWDKWKDITQTPNGDLWRHHTKAALLKAFGDDE